MKGRIICINAAIHRVLLENNTIIDAKTRGKLRNEKVTPVVGDIVVGRGKLVGQLLVGGGWYARGKEVTETGVSPLTTGPVLS